MLNADNSAKAGKAQDTVNIKFQGVDLAGYDYWQTRDGRFLAVKDMSSDHILRCIGKIFRSKIGWRAGYLPHLQAELNRRESDGAAAELVPADGGDGDGAERP